MPVGMECAGTRSGNRCGGAASRRCPRCRVVGYCSLAHQVSHWSAHKSECDRLKEQMKRAVNLNDFPFTFSEEASLVKEKRCSFLERQGVHRLGMWACECSCGESTISFGSPRLIDDFSLPSKLCPCKEPSSLIPEHMASWKKYYEWRCLPLCSPAAVLLHFPLTVYWAIQLATQQGLLPQIRKELRIHYLGAEKELLQLAVFGELQALFPGLQLNLDMVGPAIPEHRNSEQIWLHSYAHCNDIACRCKQSIEDCSRSKASSKQAGVRVRLHSGYYHDCYRELSKDSVPDVIISANAGIAAYTSWLPSIELIKSINVPAIFTDYCEEACHLSARNMNSVLGIPLKNQIQINPFRQPLQVEENSLDLPCYSNGFIFGI